MTVNVISLAKKNKVIIAWKNKVRFLLYSRSENKNKDTLYEQFGIGKIAKLE